LTLEGEEEVEVKEEEEEATAEEGKTGCCLRSKKGRPAVVLDQRREDWLLS
jgi:hypothetical protein